MCGGGATHLAVAGRVSHHSDLEQTFCLEFRFVALWGNLFEKPLFQIKLLMYTLVWV